MFECVLAIQFVSTPFYDSTRIRHQQSTMSLRRTWRALGHFKTASGVLSAFSSRISSRRHEPVVEENNEPTQTLPANRMAAVFE